MNENLIFFATNHSCFGNWGQIFFSIYHILMIKTYVASLELQYSVDNQLVSNYLLIFFTIY
jgi:hypothetical protein